MIGDKLRNLMVEQVIRVLENSDDFDIDFAMFDDYTERKPESKIESGNKLRDRIVKTMPSYMKFVDKSQDREEGTASATMQGVLPFVKIPVTLDIYVKATWDELKVKMVIDEKTPIMSATIDRYEPEESVVRRVKRNFKSYTNTVIPKKRRTK